MSNSDDESKITSKITQDTIKVDNTDTDTSNISSDVSSANISVQDSVQNSVQNALTSAQDTPNKPDKDDHSARGVSDDDVTMMMDAIVAKIDDEIANKQAALDALANDSNISEVEAPSPESLEGPSPVLEDLPDTAPTAPVSAPTSAAPVPSAPIPATQDPHQNNDTDPNAQDDAEETVDLPTDSTNHANDSDEAATNSNTAQPQSPQSDNNDADELETAAMQTAAQSPAQTLPFTPVAAPVHAPMTASGSSRISGAASARGSLAWGSRSDVGKVREHNEDSYLINFPLFAVADGMGGHAAGEIASTIAVSSLAECGVTKADPYALGAAVEQANQEVLAGAKKGVGRTGMGTTCTSIVIDGNRMAVGHVGDSRCYLLHAGKLLRVTHDHSFVEELVEAGEITPEEARVHPNRSIITRALGSDPNMRADAFTVDVTMGDRVLLCSDGLSSMITDAAIEDALACTPSPQTCADRLVDLALAAGGMDNVTVIVIDVKDDGIERHALRNRIRNIALWVIVLLLVLACVAVGLSVYAHNSWYLTDSDGYVSLNRGLPGSFGALTFSEQVELTNIEVSDLSQAIEDRLARGITFSSEDDARAVLEQYRSTIEQRQANAQAASATSASATSVAGNSAEAGSTSETPALPSNLTGLKQASSQADANSQTIDDQQTTSDSAVSSTSEDPSVQSAEQG